MTGFAVCRSFCNHEPALNAMRDALDLDELLPILSESTASIDTRFGTAAEFRRKAEEICGRRAFTGIAEAETISGENKLDALIVCPCTGNTLSKIAHGITDSCVTMAVKAHVRCRGFVVLALATNDALSGSFPSLARLYDRKCFYFVPLAQDAPNKKPTSLVCDFERLNETVRAARLGVQLQPFLP